jgi:hypothetical protein
MVLKEYDCPNCGAFHALIPICTRCGKTAKRAGMKEILTSGRPPGYASGVARRTDKILEQEFADRGITNFTNAGGVSRPTFSDRGSMPAGLNLSVLGEAPAAPPIQAGYASDLGRMGIDLRNMTVEGRPWQPPQADAVQAPVNANLGPRGNELLQNREVIGRTDNHGNQIE